MSSRSLPLSARSSGGMVVSPHALASEAGAAMLAAGGSAVDAAIAANAVLAVVYPHMCGVGGDAFLLAYDATRRTVHALTAAGRAPAAATVDALTRRGLHEIAPRSAHAVTVPGAVAGWVEAHRRFGRRPFADLFARAIRYAHDGVPITAKLARWIAREEHALRRHPSTARILLADDRVPSPGAPLVQRDLGRTLETIATEGRDSFYEGSVAGMMTDFLQTAGGLHAQSDFADQQAEWTEPIRGHYRGVEIFQTPPPSQGFVTLLMLNMLADDALAELPFLGSEHLHLLVETKKVAFADRDRHLADPDFARVPLDRLLDRNYARERRRLVDSARASAWDRIPAGSLEGDTVSIGAVDAQGNAASLIQSLYFGFGSAMVAEDTGVLLHNRGAYFSLDPAHPNRLEPRKRPLHTLMASLAFRDDRLWLVFGCMGADGQPQIHLQVYSAMLDHGLDLAAAIEAPRWLAGRFAIGDPRELLHVEARVPVATRADLERRGHAVTVLAPWDELTGHAHGIAVMDDGTRLGVADPRSDGGAAGV